MAGKEETKLTEELDELQEEDEIPNELEEYVTENKAELIEMYKDFQSSARKNGLHYEGKTDSGIFLIYAFARVLQEGAPKKNVSKEEKDDKPVAAAGQTPADNLKLPGV